MISDFSCFFSKQSSSYLKCHVDRIVRCKFLCVLPESMVTDPSRCSTFISIIIVHRSDHHVLLLLVNAIFLMHQSTAMELLVFFALGERILIQFDTPYDCDYSTRHNQSHFLSVIPNPSICTNFTHAFEQLNRMRK